MQRHEIKSGSFTMLVSLCGQYHVAPGGVHIISPAEAEKVARFYGRVMTTPASTTKTP